MADNKEAALRTFQLLDEQFPLVPFYRKHGFQTRYTYVPVQIRPDELSRGVDTVIAARVEAMNGTCTHSEFLHRIVRVVDKFNTRIGNVNLGTYGLEYNVTIEAQCGVPQQNDVLFGCEFIAQKPEGLLFNFSDSNGPYIRIVVPQDHVPEDFVPPTRMALVVTNSLLKYGERYINALAKPYYYPRYSPQVRMIQMSSAERPKEFKTNLALTDVRPRYRDLLAEAVQETGLVDLLMDLCNPSTDPDPKERTLEELAARVGVQEGILVADDLVELSEKYIARVSSSRMFIYDGESHNEELYAAFLAVGAAPLTCAIRINNLSNPATVDLITLLSMRYNVVGIYVPFNGNHFDGSAYLMGTNLNREPGIDPGVALAFIRNDDPGFLSKKKANTRYWTNVFGERHPASQEFYNLSLDRFNAITASYTDIATYLAEQYGPDLPRYTHIIEAYRAAQTRMRTANPPIRKV